jgi:hypothetical protein
MRGLGLTIGCGYYGNRNLLLNGTVTDSLNMNKLLEDMNYEVINMNDKNYTIESYPSKANIIKQMNKILSLSSENDNVVISFAGHGKQTVYSNNNIEELDGRDEGFLPSDYNFKDDSLLKDDEILQILKDNLSDKKINLLILFDCCHSGTMCDLQYTYEKSLTRNSYKMINNKNDNDMKSNIIMISGCKDKQVSWGANIKFNYSYRMMQGVMTGSFIEGVKKNIVNIFDLVHYMYKHTNKYKQHPQISCNNNLLSMNKNRQILFINEGKTKSEKKVFKKTETKKINFNIPNNYNKTKNNKIKNKIIEKNNFSSGIFGADNLYKFIL